MLIHNNLESLKLNGTAINIMQDVKRTTDKISGAKTYQELIPKKPAKLTPKI